MLVGMDLILFFKRGMHLLFLENAVVCVFRVDHCEEKVFRNGDMWGASI